MKNNRIKLELAALEQLGLSADLEALGI